VVEHFLRAASENSAKGKETCGLLVGRLTAETLTLTAVIIPKQGGDKDSCQPTDEGESEVFQYQVRHNNAWTLDYCASQRLFGAARV